MCDTGVVYERNVDLQHLEYASKHAADKTYTDRLINDMSQQTDDERPLMRFLFLL